MKSFGAADQSQRPLGQPLQQGKSREAAKGHSDPLVIIKLTEGDEGLSQIRMGFGDPSRVSIYDTEVEVDVG